MSALVMRILSDLAERGISLASIEDVEVSWAPTDHGCTEVKVTVMLRGGQPLEYGVIVTPEEEK